MKQEVIHIDLGLIPYDKAWEFQEKLFKKNIDIKIAQRNGNEVDITKNYLITCQHPHVYTLGKSGNSENLLLKNEELNQINASFYKINRGGDITYHGPGQLVVYPIFDLDYFFSDIHRYMRYLEEAVIQTLSVFGIKGDRVEGATGVWLNENSINTRKICAMGVKCSRWVTMHGIGFNINSDLSYFSNIIPCGIQDKSVTSMKNELKKEVDFSLVQNVLLKKMSEIFDYEYVKNNLDVQIT
ncbi:MAG: lipoyl(octanoyl) transferase LipB [Flavobacteriia bacterium]|nr:lipoyl(octanoyl) transferase LipB [Flavobacteriia bacterium]